MLPRQEGLLLPEAGEWWIAKSDPFRPHLSTWLLSAGGSPQLAGRLVRRRADSPRTDAAN
jgi:hypothetical protein